MSADVVELRVLGCLIEKQRTTPDAYPLSLNSLRLACNQSTNRDPVVDYDEAAIRDALQRLSARGWVRLASGRSSRAVKYRQLFDEALSLSSAELSLLTILMLRGAQTVGELKSRTERLHRFGSLAEVDETLQTLVGRELVRETRASTGPERGALGAPARRERWRADGRAAELARGARSPARAAGRGATGAARPRALAVLERVERDREREHEPAIGVEVRLQLEHVPVAELSEHAPVRPDLLAVVLQGEVERKPREHRENVGPEVGDTPDDRDQPARLVRLEELVSARDP